MLLLFISLLGNWSLSFVSPIMHFEFLNHVGNLNLDIKFPQGISLQFHFLRSDFFFLSSPEPHRNRTVSCLSFGVLCRFFSLLSFHWWYNLSLWMSWLLQTPHLHVPHHANTSSSFQTPWSLEAIGAGTQTPTPREASANLGGYWSFSSLFISGNIRISLFPCRLSYKFQRIFNHLI